MVTVLFFKTHLTGGAPEKRRSLTDHESTGSCPPGGPELKVEARSLKVRLKIRTPVKVHLTH